MMQQHKEIMEVNGNLDQRLAEIAYVFVTAPLWHLTAPVTVGLHGNCQCCNDVHSKKSNGLA